MTLSLIVGLLGFAPAAHAAVTSNVDFVAVTPQRLADTRTNWSDPRGTGKLVGAGQTLQVVVAGSGARSSEPIPSNASSVSLNVTVTEAQGSGFVTVFPCGEPRPLASNLNYSTGQTVPNAVIAAVGEGRKVCLFASTATHLIVDLNGYMRDQAAYFGITPERAADTRDGTGVRKGFVPAAGTLVVPVGAHVPDHAMAAVLNVTVTEPASDGWVSVYPCNEPRQLASNLNFSWGQTVPNMVISALSYVDQTACIYSTAATHLVVDVNGYFADWADYYPFTPERLADTRPGSSALGELTVADAINYPHPAGEYYEIQVAEPGELAAISLNVTVTQPRMDGFVTVFGCESGWFSGASAHTDHPGRYSPWLPPSSSLNFRPGQTVPNAVVTPVDAHGYVCFYTSVPTHLVVDANGVFPTSF